MFSTQQKESTNGQEIHTNAGSGQTNVCKEELF